MEKIEQYVTEHPEQEIPEGVEIPKNLNLSDEEFSITTTDDFKLAIAKAKIMEKLLGEMEQAILDKNAEKQTITKEIQAIESSKSMVDSSLAEKEIAEREKLKQTLSDLKTLQKDDEDKYNASEHQRIKDKSEDTSKDDMNRANLTTEEREHLLENDDNMKALMARIEDALHKIDAEWIKNIQIDDSFKVDLEATINSLPNKGKNLWQKILYWTGTVAGTSLVGASSGVGAGQLGLLARKDKMTNEGAVVLMIVGAILGAGAYLHNI
jgi:hypothetical protein